MQDAPCSSCVLANSEYHSFERRILMLPKDIILLTRLAADKVMLCKIIMVSLISCSYISG